MVETSVFIAKLLGPCFLIIGLGILFNRKHYNNLMEDFCKNSAMLYFGGITALAIGILIVLSHNVWAADWRVIITIFGWGGIIKGTWLLVFPNTASAFVGLYQKNKVLLLGHSFLVIIIGAWLTAAGYFMKCSLG